MQRLASAIAMCAVLTTACSGPQHTAMTAPAKARAAGYVPHEVVVPWRNIPYTARKLPPFPGSVRDPRVPRCTAAELRMHAAPYQSIQQGEFTTIWARNVGTAQCGLQGTPTVVALSAGGRAISPSHVPQRAFPAQSWLRMAPKGRPAVLTVDLMGVNIYCYVGIAHLVVTPSQPGGSVQVQGPGGGGCGRRHAHHEAVEPSPWSRTEVSNGPDATDLVEPRISREQRTVRAGGILHFQLELIGIDVRRVLRPCLPIEEFSDIYETADDGQYIPIHVLPARGAPRVS
jgi:hypothetical protein